MFLGVKEAKIGNIFDEKLNKYNNPWFIKLSANKVPKKCDECELPPICDRACKAVCYDYFGDFIKHKPLCEL
jgi:radical SAM protein with 4Fe4S-binding SPASM domain